MSIKAGNFNKKYRSGHWNSNEKLRYALFLEYYQKYLNDTSFKKSKKVFKMMARFIKTRNQNQCRGHHYKTINTYKTN